MMIYWSDPQIQLANMIPSVDWSQSQVLPEIIEAQICGELIISIIS